MTSGTELPHAQRHSVVTLKNLQMSKVCGLTSISGVWTPYHHVFLAGSHHKGSLSHWQTVRSVAFLVRSGNCISVQECPDPKPIEACTRTSNIPCRTSVVKHTTHTSMICCQTTQEGKRNFEHTSKAGDRCGVAPLNKDGIKYSDSTTFL